MTVKKDVTKTKAEKPKTVKPKSTTRKTINNQSVKVKPVKIKQEPETVFIDRKSLKTINSLTVWLSVAAVLNTFFVFVQLWATAKAGYVHTWVSVLYTLLYIVLICALVWCVYLLKKRKALAFWVFAGYITINFIHTTAFRLYEGKAFFDPLDIVVYIVEAAIIFDLYRLKRNDVLA
jgi:hypothetical protein